MRYSRRRFCLSLSALWPLLSNIPASSAQTSGQLPASNPKLTDTDFATLGLATAYDTAQSPSQQRQLIQIVTLIASQRVLIDQHQKSVDQAADTIRSAIVSGTYLYPDVFGAVADLYDPDTSPNVALSSISAQAITSGAVASIGSGVDALTGGSGAVGGTGMAALLAMLSNGASSAPDSSPSTTSRLPLPFRQDTFALTAWTTTELYRAISVPGTAQALAMNLSASGHLPINPARTPQNARQSLPDSQSTIAAAQSMVQQVAESTIRAQLSDAVKRLDAKTQKILDESDGEDDIQRQAELQAQRTAANAIVTELNGAGMLANVVVTQSAGDPAVAKTILGFAQTTIKVYGAMLSPAVGPLAMAGTFADAASTLMGLGMSSTDPLMAALQPIQNRLNQIAGQLDVIQRREAQIITQLGQIYTAVLTANTQLTIVRQQVSALANLTANAAVTADRSSFEDVRNKLATARLNSKQSGRDIASDQLAYHSYQNWMTSCYTFAHNNARDPVTAEDPTQQLTNAAWIGEIQQRNRVDETIGVLALAANRLGLPVPSIPNSPGLSPVNPSAWAEGVNAYLEAKAYVPAAGGAAARTQLEALWWDGWQVRALILLVVHPNTIAKLRDTLLQQAGLPVKRSDLTPDTYTVDSPAVNAGLAGAIYQASRDWCQSNVQVPLQGQATNHGNYFVSYTQIGVSTGIGRCDFSPDLFQQLINASVLGYGPPQKPGQLNAQAVYVRAPGPWKDQLLLPDDVSLRDPTPWPQSCICYPAFTNGNANQPVRRPELLQQAAIPIAHAYIYRPMATRALPGAVNAKLATYTATDYVFWGEMARVIGLYAQWRSADIGASNVLCRANCSGPFTIAEVSDFASDYATNRLSLTGYWPGELHSALHDQISATCNGMIESCLTAGTQRSVQVVDDTLRKIEGFMRANGWSIPVSPPLSA